MATTTGRPPRWPATGAWPTACRRRPRLRAVLVLPHPDGVAGGITDNGLQPWAVVGGDDVFDDPTSELRRLLQRRVDVVDEQPEHRTTGRGRRNAGVEHSVEAG